MADLTITAADVALVKAIEQFTVPAHEALNAGTPVYLVEATGKAGKADANGSAPVNEPEGIAIKSAYYANEGITIVKQGWVDLGDALDGLNYGDPVFLSATAGALADADDAGVGILIGEVWPSFGATTADKILRVDIKSLVDIAPASITNAMMAANSIDSDQYVDGSIDNAHLAANSVDSAQIVAGAVDKTHLSGGFLKVSLVDGQDETSGPDLTYTLTGAAVGDEVVAVIHLSTKASIATAAALTGYTITGTDELSSGSAVDLSSDQLMVIWLDLT